jgi:hypothetical protein
VDLGEFLTRKDQRASIRECRNAPPTKTRPLILATRSIPKSLPQSLQKQGFVQLKQLLTIPKYTVSIFTTFYLKLYLYTSLFPNAQNLLSFLSSYSQKNYCHGDPDLSLFGSPTPKSVVPK